MFRRLRKRMNNEEGFTLIELMIVIAVLGILAGIAIPRLGGVKNKAEDAKINSAAAAIRSAMEMYYAENDSYPASNEIDDYEDLQGTVDDYVTLPDLTDSSGNDLVSSLTYNSDSDQYLLEITSSATSSDYYIGDAGFGDATTDATSGGALN